MKEAVNSVGSLRADAADVHPDRAPVAVARVHARSIERSWPASRSDALTTLDSGRDGGRASLRDGGAKLRAVRPVGAYLDEAKP
jgi:hypothetical protein